MMEKIKKTLTKWGLWQEIEEITRSEKEFFIEAQKHFCASCDKWFKDFRSKSSHQRVAHEGVMKKNA